MKRYLLVLIIILLCVGTVYSKKRSAGPGFENNSLYVGPILGYGWEGLGVGVQGEYSFEKGIFGTGKVPGQFGIGGDITYTTFDTDFWFFNDAGYWTHTMIGIAVFASWHPLNDQPFDPFVRLGFGYFNWSEKWTWKDNRGNQIPTSSGSYNTGLDAIASAGIRYHLSDFFSLRAVVGYPYWIAVGFDLGF